MNKRKKKKTQAHGKWRLKGIMNNLWEYPIEIEDKIVAVCMCVSLCSFKSDDNTLNLNKNKNKTFIVLGGQGEGRQWKNKEYLCECVCVCEQSPHKLCLPWVITVKTTTTTTTYIHTFVSNNIKKTTVSNRTRPCQMTLCTIRSATMVKRKLMIFFSHFNFYIFVRCELEVLFSFLI